MTPFDTLAFFREASALSAALSVLPSTILSDTVKEPSETGRCITRRTTEPGDKSARLGRKGATRCKSRKRTRSLYMRTE